MASYSPEYTHPSSLRCRVDLVFRLAEPLVTGDYASSMEALKMDALPTFTLEQKELVKVVSRIHRVSCGVGVIPLLALRPCRS
jgi:hypothetical protein